MCVGHLHVWDSHVGRTRTTKMRGQRGRICGRGGGGRWTRQAQDPSDVQLPNGGGDEGAGKDQVPHRTEITYETTQRRKVKHNKTKPNLSEKAVVQRLGSIA